MNLGIPVNTQLLCTFVSKPDLDLVIDYIIKTYSIPERRIFVFENVHNTDDLYCTYNIIRTDLLDHGKNTILIHRKKESNTLYTVNALNVIIREMNNGILDKSLPINWPLYGNSLLLTNSGALKQIKLQFFGVRKF